MLISVGILTGTYVGYRVYEFVQSRKTKTRPINETVAIKQESKKDLKSLDLSQKEADRFYNLSLFSMGLSIAGTFLPVATIVNIGVISYLNIPVFKRTEKLLFQHGKLGNDALLGLFTVAGVALNQFFAVALTFWFYYFGSRVIANINDYSKNTFTRTFNYIPPTIWVMRQGLEIEIPTVYVTQGDVVIINRGDVIAVDGYVVKGEAVVDQHAITGREQPLVRQIGQQVVAGTRVLQGTIHVRAERVGKDRTLMQIAELVSQDAKDRVQNTQLRGDKWADQIALAFLSLYGLAVLTVGPYRGLVVLTGKFGNRLRAVTPLGTLSFIEIAHFKGMLVKEGTALENMRHVDTVVVDMVSFIQFLDIKQVLTEGKHSQEEILGYVALAGQGITSPAIQFIKETIQQRGVTMPDLEDAIYHTRHGLIIQWQQNELVIGNLAVMKQEKIKLSRAAYQLIDYCQAPNYAVVFVALNGKLAGAIELDMQFDIRGEEFTNNLDQLQQLVLVSEEDQATTKRISQEYGFEDYFYDASLDDKENVVNELQDKGQKVCYVGDGLRDTAAMEAAYISTSMRNISTVMHDKAQITLMDRQIEHFPQLFDLSNRLSKNLSTSLALTISPTLISVIGGFFFTLSVTAAMLIKMLAFGLAIGNASLPLLMIPLEEIMKQQEKQNQ
ncbi:HAD family hydrolase [Candidatus Albibeggiatoa sp. nov. NOAA]|uniref:P-type ATPase n=1 Tax=Candidatus Albibeggiatoa sp. nov. NOAA TaxID=3162724 RepID=UPI0032F88678|nr:HAD family hydrolase [Thiotrichaceae bacterium]